MGRKKKGGNPAAAVAVTTTTTTTIIETMDYLNAAKKSVTPLVNHKLLSILMDGPQIYVGWFGYPYKIDLSAMTIYYALTRDLSTPNKLKEIQQLLNTCSIDYGSDGDENERSVKKEKILNSKLYVQSWLELVGTISKMNTVLYFNKWQGCERSFFADSRLDLYPKPTCHEEAISAWVSNVHSQLKEAFELAKEF